MSSRPDLVDRLYEQATDRVRKGLVACVSACEILDAPLFLVGGAVRDLLLGRRHAFDIDIATEGEVSAVAERANELLGWPVYARVNERFGTALICKGLELVRARRERYSRPGALPDVEPASIAEDLARRDFTINAIAIRLTQPVGEVIDIRGGQQDVKAGLVRVLHPASFQDDATRMIRAVRYATRLGFSIEGETEGRLRRDLEYVDAISGARLRNELHRTFRESRVAEAMVMARDLGLLRAIHPSLTISNEVANRWPPVHGQPEKLAFCVLMQPADAATASSLTERLHLQGESDEALQELVRLVSLAPGLAASYDDPVAVVTLLDGARSFAVRALAIREGGRVAEACDAYLARWRNVMSELRGKDLLALGVPFGPAVGAMLWELKLARLRGEAATREDEVELVRRELGVAGAS